MIPAPLPRAPEGPDAAELTSGPAATLTRRLAWGLRVAVALSLIVLSLWSFLLPVSVPISTTAAVTARVALVAAPLQGDVRTLTADVGDRVRTGQLLVEVGSIRTAPESLVELRAQRANVETQKAALETELKETTGVKVGYDARYREYGARVVKEAERLALESGKGLEALEAARRGKAAALTQLKARGGSGAEAEADLARARLELEAAEKAVAVEAARAERLRAHVDDAKAGYYLSLGYEPPRLAGILADLDLRVAKLKAERGRLEGVAATLDAEILETEQGRRALAQRRVESPVEGVIWRRPVNVGQFVDTGAELYRIADQKTLHVQAYFHRRYLDGMATGHKASVYLVSARRVVTGTVKVIQAIDAGRGREEYALELPSPDDDHFKVVIELDAEGRRLAEIGGVAKAAVVGRLEGRLQQALMWLYLRFES